MMKKRMWTNRENSFLNYIKIRNGIHGREMLERVWAHMNAAEREDYIIAVWGDDN